MLWWGAHLRGVAASQTQTQRGRHLHLAWRDAGPIKTRGADGPFTVMRRQFQKIRKNAHS